MSHKMWLVKQILQKTGRYIRCILHVEPRRRNQKYVTRAAVWKGSLMTCYIAHIPAQLEQPRVQCCELWQHDP